MPIKKLSKYFFSKQNLLLISGVLVFLLAGAFNLKIEKPILQLSKQETALNINKELLVFMSAGNKRLFTDLLWVQTLLESDIEHYAKRDLNNWLFLRFNTISVLDPKFYENYLYGGQFLAIVKDDLEGADVIYTKGLKRYPDDYKLNYNAGFLNYYEIGNFQKGLVHLEKIVDHPRAPIFFKSIVNKLKVSTGVELSEVFKLVVHDYETTLDENLKKRLAADLYAIKAEIDLKCLNNQKGNCSFTDIDGNLYIQKDDQYYSSKSFVRYKISKREDSPPSVEKRINYIK